MTTSLQQALNWFSAEKAKFLGLFTPATQTALIAWFTQFESDEGQAALAGAEKYGPEIEAGTITIEAAAVELTAELAAQGIKDLEALAEIIFNALRTQTNAAATATA